MNAAVCRILLLYAKPHSSGDICPLHFVFDHNVTFSHDHMNMPYSEILQDALSDLIMSGKLAYTVKKNYCKFLHLGRRPTWVKKSAEKSTWVTISLNDIITQVD